MDVLFIPENPLCSVCGQLLAYAEADPTGRAVRGDGKVLFKHYRNPSFPCTNDNVTIAVPVRRFPGIGDED